MQRFSEIQYVRPDLAAYREELLAHVEKVKNAKSWEELKAEWLAHSVKSMEIMTMRSVASIRNTVDTTDAFYDGEMRYFHAELPSLMLIERQADAALLLTDLPAKTAEPEATPAPTPVPTAATHNAVLVRGTGSLRIRAGRRPISRGAIRAAPPRRLRSSAAKG